MCRHFVPLLALAGGLLGSLGMSDAVNAGEGPALTVSDRLFDSSKPATYGLPPVKDAKTITIFRPGEADRKFANGVVLMSFKDQLYAMWQASALDEDAADTVVVYAVSLDGETWSAPKPLTTVWDKGYKSSGGWWTDGKTLVAYLNAWPADLKPRGGVVEYVTSTDGVTWSTPKPVLKSDMTPLNGIFEQDVHVLPGGRLLSAAHEQPGLIAKPYYTDDPLGISGWRAGAIDNLPHAADITRELEPSSYIRRDGAVVMVFRDQGKSFRKLTSISRDHGMTWSQAVETNMPDSRSKQSAGNLPDGTAYMVNNPTGSRDRLPLALTLSGDGEHFGAAYLLRGGDADLQPRRYEGKFKNLGYNYPKSLVWKDFLYVTYTTNKEDVQVTRVPLAAIQQNF